MGEWLNDIRTGKGCLNYVNGDIYDGDCLNNMRNGKGCLHYKNGD